jgi:acetolactate synthase small subunit
MSYYNPYWNKALQNQQKSQAKPEARQASKRQRMRDGFDDEWVGKDVEVEQVKGVIRGRIIDVSRYWLKMAVDGQTLYVNKAFILSIKPAEVKDTASGGSNGGERASRPK